MEQEKIVEYKLEDLVETPKDKIEDAIVTRLVQTTWREFLKTTTDPKKYEEVLEKFKEPDKKIVVIHFKTDQTNVEGNDTANVYNPIPDNSNLGKIISKYGGLNVGRKIKIAFDGNGYTSIHLDKKK